MSYLITFIGIIECIIVGYFLGVKTFTSEINKNAEIKLGKIFSFMIRVLTPLVLIVSFVLSLRKELINAYEGYSVTALATLGAGVLVFVIITAIILGSIRTKNDKEWEKIEEKLLKK